jgi:hypothetical protein
VAAAAASGWPIASTLQEMVALQCGLPEEAIDDRQCGLGALGHAYGNGAIEVDDRRAHEGCQLRIEFGNA